MVDRSQHHSFGEGPRLDHASLYAEICLEMLSSISSQSLHDPTHPASSMLWSIDIKAAQKYIEEARCGFMAENIGEHITILIHHCNQTECCTATDKCIMNKIDHNITEIILAAKRNCKKAKGHTWPPLLANAGHAVIAAKWHLSDLYNGWIQVPLWEHATAIIQAKAQVKEAYALLQSVQKDAKQIRDAFLEDRAEHLAETQQSIKKQHSNN